MAAFFAPCLLVLALMLITLGYRLAHGRLAERRQALDAEWQALDNIRRVRAVFLYARLAMRGEALRAAQTSHFKHGRHNQGGQQ